MPGTLPKGASRIPASRLSIGDLVFLETAASGDPVRSLVLEIRESASRRARYGRELGHHFKVMNGLNPDPYEVFLPDSQMVWVLKMSASTPRPREEEDDNPREPPPFRPPRSTFRSPFATSEDDEDFRSYWNWDKNDRRASQEFYTVEEREWRRLRGASGTHRSKTQPHPRIDPKSVELYTLLNVRAGVTLKELKSAYKKAAFRYHPDRCKDSNAEEMFKKVSSAYEKLRSLLERA